ncbi:MAG: xylulokinase [Opitutales bacterium]
MPQLLGIDASTQSCSGIVIDTDSGSVVAEVSINFGKELPQYGAPQGYIPDAPDGTVHANPLMWLDALDLMFERLAAQCDLSEIAAVSGAGQQHGSVYLNDQWASTIGSLNAGQSLSDQIKPCLSRESAPIWMDASTGDSCKAIRDAVGGDEAVCAKTGSIAIERFTGPQIHAFNQRDPEGYAQTKRIHLVSSFLASILSGSDAPIDTGDGAGMNLLNLASGDWDPELLEATAPALGDKLPEAASCDTVIGTTSSYFSAKYGLSADIPVTIFTGDNPSSLVGMGASQPGKVVISLGTSDTFFAAMPGLATDPNGCGHVFGNPSDGFMSLQCFLNGSLAREKVKDPLGYDWDNFSNAITSTAPGNGGRLMIPFFGDEISPRVYLEEPKLSGPEGFISGEEKDEQIRACVEGQFLNMANRSAWMELKTDTIYLTGGASRSDAIAQIVADIFQAKVERLAVSGSVGLGAAMRAGTGAGIAELSDLEAQFCQPEPGSAISPNADTAGTYSEMRTAFDALLEA